MPSAEYAKVETWKLRGLIAAECAVCHAVGIELRIGVAVEMRVTPQPAGPDDDEMKFTMGMRVVDGSQPVEMECLACGNLVKHGDVAEVTTHGEQHDGARTEADGGRVGTRPDSRAPA